MHPRQVTDDAPMDLSPTPVPAKLLGNERPVVDDDDDEEDSEEDEEEEEEYDDRGDKEWKPTGGGGTTSTASTSFNATPSVRSTCKRQIVQIDSNKNGCNSTEGVQRAARSLFSKRTRTLYHWLYPGASKARLKATVAAAWETLSLAEKRFYESQVVGKFDLAGASNVAFSSTATTAVISAATAVAIAPTSSLMVNPRIGHLSALSEMPSAKRIVTPQQPQQRGGVSAPAPKAPTSVSPQEVPLEDEFAGDEELRTEFRRFRQMAAPLLLPGAGLDPLRDLFEAV